MKAAAKATLRKKKGDAIVHDELRCDRRRRKTGGRDPGSGKLEENAADLKDSAMTHAEGGRKDAVDFVNNIQAKVNAQEGNSLPVSAFKDYVDGTTLPVLRRSTWYKSYYPV